MWSHGLLNIYAMYLKEVEMEGPLKQQDTKKGRDVTPAQLADTYLFSSYPGNVSHSFKTS